MSDVGIFFVVSGKVNNLVGDTHDGLIAFNLFSDLKVGSFEKAVRINTGIKGKVGDQTDVRSFRGTNRTGTGVLRGVNITHGEGSAFAGDTTWTHNGDTSKIVNFRKRIDLVKD